MDLCANLETYQVGAHFEALDEGVLLMLLNPRYTQVGFNLISVQVCDEQPKKDGQNAGIKPAFINVRISGLKIQFESLEQGQN